MVCFSLTIIVIISAVLHILADHRNKRYQTYFFKPLTILLIILIGSIQTVEVSTVYQYLIIAGLCFALVGDVFLMLPTDRFLYGLAFFLLAHIFYISAFISDAGFPLNIWYLLPGLLIGVIALKVLLPATGSKSVPVILYTSVIVLLLWQAFGRMDASFNHSTVTAATGALLFAFSDMALAFNKFVRKFKNAQFLILGTYYTAQLLIAYSI